MLRNKIQNRNNEEEDRSFFIVFVKILKKAKKCCVRDGYGAYQH